jgi:alkylresorcinol/alkylpyrone synthase
VVVIELCTLACRIDRGSKADVVSWALFGDGAAAVLRAGPSDAKVRIGAAAEHTWPRTLDIMGWMIDPVGAGSFSRARCHGSSSRSWLRRCAGS